jgi:hypothetical protein
METRELCLPNGLYIRAGVPQFVCTVLKTVKRLLRPARGRMGM